MQQLVEDIVERLHDRAASYRAGGPGSEHTATMLEEAADEIGFLRKDRDYWYGRYVEAIRARTANAAPLTLPDRGE